MITLISQARLKLFFTLAQLVTMFFIFSPEVNLASELDAGSALVRASQIKNISYQLDFSFELKALQYVGTSKIHFEWRDSPRKISQSLRLDTMADEITEFYVGDFPVDQGRLSTWKKNGFLEIPLEVFGELKGKTALTIKFKKSYETLEDGLYRYTDKKDGSELLYTNLEPFGAHRVFPCFDQPDLKATYTVSVHAPRSWVVVSNTKEDQIAASKTSKQHQVTTFKESDLFSPYIFALIVGDYKVIESKKPFRYPLRLLVRKSLSQLVDAERWFTITRKGFDFFESYFGTKYPYKKYDQIIAPDMRGAMENVGAVTYTEQFVYDSPPSSRQLMARTETILHELSHMWFGNLVTMRWWNGLWLNESFATYISQLAIERTKIEPNLDTDYYRNTHLMGLHADQKPSSHPIEVQVNSTQDAFANFDAITYSKGAAVLKQLHFKLGEQEFRSGLRRYFAKHPSKNTVAEDFFSAMQNTKDGVPTLEWTKSWYLTKSPNVLKPIYKCTAETNAKIESFFILQTSLLAESPLREHDFLIKTWLPSGKVETTRVSLLGKQPLEAVPSFVGTPCPDFILINANTHGFFSADADPKSLEFLKHGGLGKITVPLDRLMAWRLIKNAVVTGVMNTQSYLDLVFKHLNVKDPNEVRDLMTPLFSRSTESFAFLELVSKNKVAETYQGLHSYAVRELFDSNTQDQKQVWFDIVLESVFLPEQRRQIESWLVKSPFRAFKLTAERKFKIRLALIRSGAELTLNEATLSQEDPSARSKRRYAILQTVRPNSEVATILWNSLFRLPFDKIKPDSITMSTVLTDLSIVEQLGVAQYLFHPRLSDFAISKQLTYFSDLDHALLQNTPDEQLKTLGKALYPRTCSQEFAANTVAWLSIHPNISPTLKRILGDEAAAESKCARLKEPDIEAKFSPAPLTQDSGLSPVLQGESEQKLGSPAPMR